MVLCISYTVNVLFKQYSNKTIKFHRVKSFRPNKTKPIIGYKKGTSYKSDNENYFEQFLYSPITGGTDR